MSDSFLTLGTVALQAPLASNSPGKNIGVGCHFLLQGIFPTQGLKPHLLHCRWNLLLSHQAGPTYSQHLLFKMSKIKWIKDLIKICWINEGGIWLMWQWLGKRYFKVEDFFPPYLEREFAKFSLRHRKHFEIYDRARTDQSCLVLKTDIKTFIDTPPVVSEDQIDTSILRR